ncbi:NADPH-dependent 2,4-dienoyl-CoA reductase/sulfur reductase-like enzyme [Pseudarthrobacter sp. PvP004]|uniref:NAD(P)/FAD-dependent oxidoreductase n=1 Tax=Pseudarthrobacter sp. PvP004 TaxID=2817850 RepID=UPI001AE846E8|nr:FAD/NAD(P)-binding oxidoreductase [Pseudarthrobacter sp. PvP004]MBP2266369.1 NADPH-dependent 2,4-dienoyl-CoA reductase/sulfur reductase-like enzyme [Pseudarthrobacter sp. PvP004]
MSLGTPERIVVVGGSAAGLSTAEALRRGGYTNKLTIIGAEKHHPYDRPPLSKQFLTGEWDTDKVMLRPEAHLVDLDVETRLGVPAGGLDLKSKLVVLTDGTELGYDRLVLATGVEPKNLPGADQLQGVLTLRSLDDAIALRAALHAHSRVVVIGGGFMGTEISAVAVSSGADVTLLSGAGAPLEPIVGAEIATQLAQLHRARGVRIRTGADYAVASILHDGGKATGVGLKNGTSIDADLVVIAIGSTPAVEWLRTSGLEIKDGVECAPDSSAAPSVYAAGDVARWHNTLFGVSMRVEHRTNAVDQGIHVAEQIVSGTSSDYRPIPYFWSDQYDLKLQSFGWLRNHDEVRLVEGSLEEGKFVALFRRNRRLTGVLGARSLKSLRKWRQYISEEAHWEDAIGAP